MLMQETKKGMPVINWHTFKGDAETSDVKIPAIVVIDADTGTYDAKQGITVVLLGGRIESINNLVLINPTTLGDAKAKGLNLTAALDNADRLNLSELNKFQIKWCIDHQ